MNPAEIEGPLRDQAGFAKDEKGIWRQPAGQASEEISYPEDGNQECFEIEEGSFWFSHRNRVIEHALEKFPIPGDEALIDIGGGNGFVSKRLAAKGHSVVLLEPGYAGCQRAKERGVVTVICAPLSKLLGAGIQVSGASAFDVVEHIDRDDDFVEQVRTLLVPGGRFFVTVPALMSLWSPEDETAGHFRRYTRKTIADLFDKNGWKVEYCGYFFTYLTLPILLSRRLMRGRRGNDPSQQAKSDHLAPKSSVTGLVTKVLNTADLILAKIFGGRIPGSSLLLVATRR